MILLDLLQSARWLRRHPGLTAVVIGTLGSAFAAVLATFAILNAIVLRPLPFSAPDRIVNVSVTGPTVPRAVRSTSRPNFEDWRERAGAFSALSAYSPLEFRLTGRGDPRELTGIRVAGGFDRVLGIQPVLGRLFGPADYAAAAPNAIVITHAFWQSAFGGSGSIIGQLLRLDGRELQIVGVLPHLDARFPLDRHEFWIPLIPRAGAFWEHSRGTGWLFVVGRVRDDRTIAAAQAELTAIAQTLEQEHPDSNKGRSEARLTPIDVEITGPIEPVLQLLAAALGAVLLVACGTVASLLVASVSRRRREFAVRAALGAGRWRLARQMLGESAMMSLVAAAAGLAVAPLLIRAFVALYPESLPRVVPAAIDGATGAAALVLAAAATVVLGLPQALHARRILEGGMGALGGAARTTAAARDRFVHGTLVTIQVAFSFVLIAAGLAFVMTLARLHRVDTGYDPQGVLTFTVSPSPAQASGAAALRFYEDVVTAIADLPGVRAAAAAVAAPMTTGGWRFGIRPRGATADVLVGVNLTTPAYFEALGIRVIEGRLLSADEQRRSTNAAVVNEPLARLLGGNVVGRSLDYSGTTWEIVGVVEGVRHGRVRDEPMPELIIPWHMAGRRPQSLIVRAGGDVMTLLPAIAARIHAVDPSAPLSDVARLEDRLQDAVAAERFRAVLLSALAAIAVALAVLGAYSVTAYVVAQRSREFGIRLALGERPVSIGRRALTSAVVPSVLGVCAGSMVAMWSSRWVESFLYGVRPVEPLAMLGTGLGLIILALFSGASSARRAARINPASSLSVE